MLILLDHNPPNVWVQYTKPFSSTTYCVEYIAESHPIILEKLYNNMKMNEFKILDMKCMTHPEAVELNNKLGH